MKLPAFGIRVQFLLAGVVLVAATAVSSGWSAWSFREVSRVVDATLRDSEQTTAATATLATALEREDDALLLTLTDEARGRQALELDRAAVSESFYRLDLLLTGPGERETSDALSRDLDAYHRAGDELLLGAHDTAARLRYHEVVNPLLRRAVGATAQIRDDHFRSAQAVASWARDRATRSTEILSAVTLGALTLSLFVALYLARGVVQPIRQLTSAVEAMRQGNFERRIPNPRGDEFGQLADGFNRMAADLAAFQRANVEEVIRAKETLEATLAALPDAVVVVSPDGAVTSVNPRALEVMRSTSRVDSLNDLPVSEGTKTALRAALGGELRQGRAAVDLSQAIALRVGDVHRKLLPRVVAIEGLANGRRGAVLVLSDVTDLVRLDEMRTELIAVASHELRTPLTTLRMTLLLLQEHADALAARDRELVRTALLGIDQLASTVDEFLDLTRIEAGQLRLNLDRVDVDALLRREGEAIRSACDEAGIALIVEGARSCAVRGDTARLHVVVANLLANALKYTPSGGRISMQTTRTEGEVLIAVEDSGPGVPTEFRERIFEKFFRVEHHREGDVGVRGSGIGLYIAREIAEAHGGRLTYDGRATGGARVVLVLPAPSSTS